MEGGRLQVLGAVVEVTRVTAPDAPVTVTAVDIRPDCPGLAPVCVTLTEEEVSRLVSLLCGGAEEGPAVPGAAPGWAR